MDGGKCRKREICLSHRTRGIIRFCMFLQRPTKFPNIFLPLPIDTTKRAWYISYISYISPGNTERNRAMKKEEMMHRYESPREMRAAFVAAGGDWEKILSAQQLDTALPAESWGGHTTVRSWLADGAGQESCRAIFWCAPGQRYTAPRDLLLS